MLRKTLLYVLILTSINTFCQSDILNDIENELEVILEKNPLCAGGMNENNFINILTDYDILEIASTSEEEQFIAKVYQICIVEEPIPGFKKGKRKKLAGTIKLYITYIDDAIQTVHSKQKKGHKLKLYPSFRF